MNECAIKSVGHSRMECGGKRSATPLWLERLVLRWIRHKHKPKRPRASLAAALHNPDSAIRTCVGSAINFNQSVMHRFALVSMVAFLTGSCATAEPTMNSKFQDYTLNYQTPVDEGLQEQLDQIDSSLRAKHGLTTQQTSVGLLDLRS